MHPFIIFACHCGGSLQASQNSQPNNLSMCLCLLDQLTSQHWYVDYKLSSATQAQSSTTLSSTLITLGFELEQVIISKVTLKVSTVKVETLPIFILKC